jgi:hypothetical protein
MEADTGSQDPGLQLSDLKTMLGIIEVINQRGAFKADELMAVGALYNRLASFVNSATPPAELPAQPETQDLNT